jgi:hypothetical protein
VVPGCKQVPPGSPTSSIPMHDGAIWRLERDQEQAGSEGFPLPGVDKGVPEPWAMDTLRSHGSQPKPLSGPLPFSAMATVRPYSFH